MNFPFGKRDQLTGRGRSAPTPARGSEARSTSNAQPGDGARDEPQDQDAGQVREAWRFALVALILAVATGLVLLRMITYQVLPNQRTASARAAPAEHAQRGSIVDRNGHVFAMDRYYYDVSATAEHLDEEGRQEVATELERLIGAPAAETMATLTELQDQKYALLAKGLTLDEARPLIDYKATLENQFTVFDQVRIDAAPQRYYPERGLAAHIVGFVGVNPVTRAGRTGLYGVERYYDRFLSSDGVGLPEAPNATLTDLDRDARRFLPSPAHKDLVLTLDRSMQWIVEEELERALNYYEAQSGTIMVMDPKTGAILALATRPVYDPNQFASASYSAFDNGAVSSQYEPGSIYKIITVAAALDTGVVTPTMRFYDEGSIAYGGRVFLNSNRQGYGEISLADALARSLNVVTVQVAAKLGADDFYEYVRRFGFGAPTEIDLANEVSGLVKSPGDPNWSVSDLAANSFGQGLAVTPIQMLNAVAAIANGGVLMRPYIVQARVVGDEVLYTEPTVVRQVISPKTAAQMVELMSHVVDIGVQAAWVPGYSVAGKTGTAQIATEEGYTEDETIVSFVGFAPEDDPQVVVLVKMDRPNPNISQWAAYTAAPVFAKVTKRLMVYLNIPPDDIRLAETGN